MGLTASAAQRRFIPEHGEHLGVGETDWARCAVSSPNTGSTYLPTCIYYMGQLYGSPHCPIW